MTFLMPTLLILIYLYLRKVWYSKRKIKTSAIVERISLCKIEPDLILPEVKIKYKYYYDGGVYFGTGYLLIRDFLGNSEYEMFAGADGFPVMVTNSTFYVSEEHIENYLLQCSPNLLIYLDPVEPFHSEINKLSAPSPSTTI